MVGGVEYELVGKISNPANYECLNGCTYAVVGGNPEIEYCFKRGYKKAVCQSEKEGNLNIKISHRFQFYIPYY